MFICCQICRNSGGCHHSCSLVRLNTLAGTLLYSSRRSNTTFRGFVNPGSTVFQDIFYLAYSYSPSIVSEYPMAWYKVVQFTRIYPDGPTITRLGTNSQDEMRQSTFMSPLFHLLCTKYEYASCHSDLKQRCMEGKSTTPDHGIHPGQCNTFLRPAYLKSNIKIDASPNTTMPNTTMPNRRIPNAHTTQSGFKELFWFAKCIGES